MNRQQLVEKIILVSNQSIAQKQYVSAVDLLLGLGYLSPTVLEDWRRGRIPFLEQKLQVNLSKLSFVMKEFRQWALGNGLFPQETGYVQKATSRTIHLKFSKSGQDNIERIYRTHYISPLLSEQKKQRLIEKIEKSPEPIVYIIISESQCSKCQKQLPKGCFLMMDNEKPYCMNCSPYADLLFLPAGDALLTRRAKKYSNLTVVVVKFSRIRKRYERQGILITEDALYKAKDYELQKLSNST